METEEKKSVLKMPIEKLELSDSLYRCLKREGVNDVEETIALIKQWDRFVQLRFMKGKYAQEVINCLRKLGIDVLEELKDPAVYDFLPEIKKCCYEPEDVIWDDGNLKVTYGGVFSFEGLYAQGYRIRLSLTNASSLYLRVECLNIFVNGYWVEQMDIVVPEIAPGETMEDSALMEAKNLLKAGIFTEEDLQSIRFELAYRVSDDYRAKKTVSPLIKVHGVLISEGADEE